ncbi:hypothetical protein COLO4_21705 [Corchorus olitorius]|uniref:Uncharacterized protein n=1 Tax=Corchorus olitorius TaxID=93759 RepID=A0A1R3IRH1_9ROSI|nr:hypothetical protein COLO4_21705 [Corchorus olitorius]
MTLLKVGQEKHGAPHKREEKHRRWAMLGKFSFNAQFRVFLHGPESSKVERKRRGFENRGLKVDRRSLPDTKNRGKESRF